MLSSMCVTITNKCLNYVLLINKTYKMTCSKVSIFDFLLNTPNLSLVIMFYLLFLN